MGGCVGEGREEGGGGGVREGGWAGMWVREGRKEGGEE